MAIPKFIFGAEGLPETPEEIARMRALASALQKRSAPRDVGEGIHALGEGIASAIYTHRARKNEQKGRSAQSDAFSSLMSSLSGAGDGSSATPPIADTSSAPGVSYSGDIPKEDVKIDPVERRIDQGFSEFESPKDTGSDVGSRLMSDLMGDFNLSKEQAAGVVGNLAHESGGFKTLQEIKPLIPGSRGGYGYAQWTGPRRRDYEAYAKENELDPSSYEANYGFLKHELTNTPEGRVLDSLKGASTAGDAAKVFSNKFLRPGIPHMESRLQRANEIMNSYSQPNQNTQTASLNPNIPDLPAIDPKTVLAQRLAKVNERALANPSEMPLTGQEAIEQAIADRPQEQGPETALTPPQGVPQAQQPTDLRTQIAQTIASQSPQQQAPESVQRVAQAMPGIDPVTMQIMDVMNNPYTSQGQKAVLGAILQQRQQSNDPLRQMQLERAQLELDQLRNPRPEFNTLTPDQVQQLGLPEGVYQQGPKGRITQIGGGGTNVKVYNSGEGGKFYETLDKKNAEMFATASDAGMTARSKIGQIDRLEGLLSQSPQGFEAGAKMFLGDMGFNTEGLDDIQATRALIEQMVPQQRPPGSGPMSDADIQMFRNSLPRLINQPGGNEKILTTMRGIAEYEVQIGNIADQVANRQLTPQEGREAMRNLKNPLSGFRESLKDTETTQAPATPDDEEFNRLLQQYSTGGAQ